MKLTVKKRTVDTKGSVKQMRRAGNIPAVLYAPGRSENQSIEVDGPEFAAALRKMKQGSLPTTVFTLDFEGKEMQAIVKEIQYHPTSYRIVHIDLQELQDAVSVQVKVPVRCVGMDNCEGIKLGGFLRQVIRHVKVKCLPKDIPAEFELNVQHLKMKQSKRVSDIAMPQGVQAVSSTKEVAALIAKR